MTLDATKTFFQRGSVNAIHFDGLCQLQEPDCVFASIAGAVNHLVRYTVWKTARELYDACNLARIGAPTFDNVIPVAIAPVPSTLRYDLPRERIKSDPPTVFLSELAACVTGGGIAIVSMEAYETQLRITGLGCWHMFTLIDKSQEWYQVWDTNNFSGSVSETELTTAVSAYGVGCQNKSYPHVWFHRHDKQDCLLLWRV